MALISITHIMLMVKLGTSAAQIAPGNKYVFWGSIALNVVLILTLICVIVKSKIQVADLREDNDTNRMNWHNLKREQQSQIRDLKTKNSQLLNEREISEELSSEKQFSGNEFEEDNSVTVELSVENASIDANEYKNEVNLVPDSLNDSQQTFYASCEQDGEIGYLVIESKRSHKTPYQIQLTDGKYSFVLDSLNREALQNAINFYNVYISPFCIPSNTFQDYYKSIMTEKDSKGVLEKEGDKFRVVEKLKIKFLEA